MVPFTPRGDKEEVPQMKPVGRQRRVRSRSATDETPQMPKARPRAKSRATSAETPYVDPRPPLNPAAGVLGEDVIPQFVAKPMATGGASGKRRGRPKKNLGLEDAKTPVIKTAYKTERPADTVKRGRGRPRKVQIVEPT